MQDKNSLSDIEQKLVMQYLMDGNVPVTLTPVSEMKDADKDTVQSVNSAVFPVALKAENIKVDKNGYILLDNPPQSVKGFCSKKVKVEFYFNRVGLFFYSDVEDRNQQLCLKISPDIKRILDVEEVREYDFKALIYFDFNNKKDINVECYPWKYEVLFSRPVWKSIPLENQHKAKDYLESFVEQAKMEKNAGNGIQLIPVCNFLTMDESDKIQSVQDRRRPVYVLYLDHERIVLGFENDNLNLCAGDQFGMKLSFSLKQGPITSRDIFVTTVTNKLYYSEDKSKICADFCYTSIQEEDLRYVYEKATKKLFI